MDFRAGFVDTRGWVATRGERVGLVIAQCGWITARGDGYYLDACGNLWQAHPSNLPPFQSNVYTSIPKGTGVLYDMLEIVRNRMINITKEKLKNGEVVIGTFVTFPSPNVVEMCGHAGFDFVILDAEHGPLTPATCENLVRAAEVTGMTPIVRVTYNHPKVILRFLDIGAQGVQIPMVKTAEDARLAVEAVKYYPQGRRGAGGARASAWGMKGGFGQYIIDSNRETMVIIQIETVESVNNVEEILAVEGVDALLIGRLDLSHAMGVPGKTDDPQVVNAVDKVIDAAQGTGVAVGLFELDAQRASHYKGRGVQFFETWVGYFMAKAAAGYMQQVRGSEVKAISKEGL